MGNVKLPVIQHDESVRGSILADGRCKQIVPADVHGRFHGTRVGVLGLLLAIAAVLPWVRIGGAPAVFLDIDQRKFFLFGATLNAQDTWLLFFLLSGIGFSLVYITTLTGRTWCGWACPQTVLLDGVFRRIERLIEGPRTAHIRRDGGPATFGRTLRKLAKHVAFIATAVFIAHVILSYFASLPAVFRMVRAAPSQHPEAFAWVLAISAALYGNFAFFREQLCVVLCPYGRLQSVLLDDDSLIIGYDARRGEPRGHKGAKGAGDCVDCAKCVAVCPTGIDIRDGLQLDCIACTACIDACDDVMDRLGRSRGLIRYDSARGLAGQSRRVIRPRMVLYTAMLVVGAVAAYLALRARRDFEANVVRLPGAPFTLEGDLVRNGFDIHVVNKVSRRAGYDVDVRVPGTASAVLSTSHVDLDPLAQGHIVVFVTASRNEPLHSRPVRVRVTRTDTPSDVVVADAMLLGTRMITLVLSALLLGLFGSAHCVLMCGGIASTLVQIGRGPRIATPAFMYNVGRIASYAVLGALVGALGHAASFVSPVGPVLRLAAGLMLVFTGLYVAGMSRLAVVERIGSPLWRRVQPFAIRARSTVVMGMLWGLMPCGLVYAGFGLAVASGGIASGALVMAAFGLGTLPSMVTASLASLRIAPFLRSRAWVRRAAGAIVLCSGLVDVGFASAAIARPAKPACACHAHT